MTERTDLGMGPKEPSGVRTAAVLMIQLLCAGVSLITPAMAILQEYWGSNPLTSALPVTLISTLPTLTTMLGVLISGALVGKAVKPKTMAVVASVFFIVFGTLPFFFYGSYALLLVCRALCGIGIGLMNPLANTIILGCYSGSKKDSLLGYSTLMINVGVLVLATLGGVLAGYGEGARFVFLSHLTGIISLVFAFMLPDPDLYQEDVAQEGVEDAEDAGKKKAKIPGSVWFCAFLLFFYGFFNYPTMLNQSTFIMNNGIDSAAAATLAALSSNCNTILGMVSAALFGRIFKKTPRWTMSVGMLSCAFGAFLIAGISTVPCICIGQGFLGFGFRLWYPACFSWVSEVSDPAANARGVSLMGILMNLGNFVSTYWLAFITMVTGDGVYFPCYVEICYLVLAAILVAFLNPWSGRKAKEPAAA